MLDQLAHAGIVATSTNGSDKQSVGSQRATNVVLDADQLALQELAVGQKRAHFLHLDILHMDGAEPAQSHHLRNSVRIIPVGFVANRRQ